MTTKISYTHLPWGRKPDLAIPLGGTEIARLVEVTGPAVVTNWRSRSADFPAERSGGTQPLFDLVEVLEWMRRSGRNLPAIPPATWWHLVARAFALQASVPSPRATLMALLVLHRATHDGHSPTAVEAWGRLLGEAATVGRSFDAAGFVESVAAVAGDLEMERPELRGLLLEQLRVPADDGGFVADLVEAVDRAGDEAPAHLLAPVLALGRDVRSRPPLATDETLAEAMVALARIPDRGSVLDPAAGEGTLLARCGRAVVGPRALLGQEIDGAAWLTARSRLFVEGIDVDLAEPGHDSLRNDQHAGRLVDAVLIDPPFTDDAPPLSLWMEFGLGHLRTGGRMVIAVPLHALTVVKVARRKPDKRLADLMQQLATDGRVSGALVLPRGLRTDVVGPLVLLEIAQTPAPTANARIPLGLVSAARRQADARLDRAVLGALEVGGVEALADLDDPMVRTGRVAPPILLRALAELGWEAERTTATTSKSPPRRTTPDRLESAPPSIPLSSSPSSSPSASPSEVAELRARLQRIEQRHDALRRAANDLLDQLELLRDRIPAEVVDRLRHDIGEVRREAF